MLRFITIALVVLFNTSEHLDAKLLLVEVADDSQANKIEGPEEGTKQEGETCGPCFNSVGSCGTCVKGLECVPHEDADKLPDLPSQCRAPQMSDDSASPDKQLLNPASNTSALNSREACGGRYDKGEKCVADHECNSYKCELDPIRHKGFRCEPCFGKKACHEPCQFNKECCSKMCSCGSPSESICCWSI